MRSALVISAVSLAAGMAAALPAAAESVTQLGSSTVIASEGPGHSLYLYRQSFGASGWKKQLIAGKGTTYSSPSVIQVLSVGVITAEGPGNTLDVYMDNGRGGAWRRSVVGGKGTTYSAPGIAVSTSVAGTAHTGTDIVVEGPHSTLNVYWNVAGRATWSEHAIAGKGTTYSAPAIVQDNGPAMNVAAEGPHNSLDFYWSSNNTKWTATPAPHSDGTVYSAPAIAVSGNVDGSGSLGTYVVVEGPDHSLRDYWNIAGVPTSGWQTVAGKNTTYSAPSEANIIGAVNIAVEGPDHALDTYWTDTSTWNPSPEGKGIIYSAPTIAATSDAGNSGEPGLEITAQGASHSLYDYWNIAGVPTWGREKVTPPGWSFA